MRGFCTIATGSHEYSHLAYNLLMSYRRFSKKGYPFTVFTDKKNDLLEHFDQVVELPKTQNGFLDKLLIFELCPYEETIFIDADSLAYGDLGDYFEFFQNADDVSCLGEVHPADSIRGWFRKEDAINYYPNLQYTVWLHGGIYYVRKTSKVKLFYKTCREIEQIYKEIFFRFKYLTEPADEPIVALAMAIHGMKPIEGSPEILAFYRDSQIKKIDIVSGKLAYHVDLGSTENGLLVHWATANTRKALYRTEARKLSYILRKPSNRYSLKWFESLYFYILYLADWLKDRISQE